MTEILWIDELVFPLQECLLCEGANFVLAVLVDERKRDHLSKAAILSLADQLNDARVLHRQIVFVFNYLAL